MDKNINEVCNFLAECKIDYSIHRHSPAFTLEECNGISRQIGGEICKNLLLKTTSGSIYYLLILKGNKKFVTKNVSKKLGTSRLSFASADEMRELLNTEPGSLSITSLIFDKEKRVKLAADKDVINEEFFLCHPSNNSATLKIKSEDITEKLLPALDRSIKIILL